MPSLPLGHKLLLDENVRADLFHFLTKAGFDVKLASKGSLDREVARLSKKEGRILVTNDSDFAEYSENKVFAVVWLQIRQSDSGLLLKSFETLLNSFKEFRGMLILLKPEGWEELPLFEEKEL